MTTKVEIIKNIVTDEDDINRVAKAIWQCRDYQIGTSDGSKWETAIFVGTFIDKPHVAERLWNYIAPYMDGNVPKATYINAHPAGLPGSWHRDDREGYMTALYYPEMGSRWPPTDYENEGGLEIHDYGVLPYQSNTLVIFPAHIPHRTLVHEKHGKIRFSVAHKMDNKGSNHGSKEIS